MVTSERVIVDRVDWRLPPAAFRVWISSAFAAVWVGVGSVVAQRLRRCRSWCGYFAEDGQLRYGFAAARFGRLKGLAVAVR